MAEQEVSLTQDEVPADLLSRLAAKSAKSPQTAAHA
jgi:hypothetical protein